ncbi:MAG: DUF2569 family protein [Sphingomonas bacterium]
MAYDSRALTGVHGWLAFFIVSLGIFSPLATLIGISTDLYGDPATPVAYGTSWPLAQGAEWAVAALTILACWYLCWRLLTIQVWKTIRIVIPSLWAITFLPQTILILLIGALLPIPFEKLLALWGGQLIRPTIYATIWTAYFLRSERVANTYERYPDDNELADVFE